LQLPITEGFLRVATVSVPYSSGQSLQFPLPGIDPDRC